jgi:signal transduction histidine kinase/CheY-like chemotaxis protein
MEQPKRNLDDSGTALLRLCHELANAATLERMFGAVVRALVAVTGFERASALAFDETGVMRFRAAHGLSHEYRAAVDGHSPWTIDHYDVQPLFVADVEAAPDLADLRPVFVAERIRALAFLPLQGGGRLLGKFMLYAEQPVAWSRVDLRFAQAAADLLASFLLREAAQERLQQARRMESLGVLAGGIAHDFNNLLTSILGYVELLRGETLRGTPARSHVDELLQTAEHAAELTKQLLGFARPQLAAREQVDLVALVAEAAPSLRRALGAACELRVELGDGPVVVLANRSQLHQLLWNLVSNARDAMPDGGLVRLVVEARGVDRVELAVVDQGVGMDEATRRRVFEPLFTTKQEGRGTGLGLATCYAIVTSLGGDIVVRSAAGRGTTVRIALPVLGDSAEAAGSGQGAATAPTLGTVLLVEDQDYVMRALQRTLVGLGYRVLTASNGRHALEVLGQAGVDAVVSDVVMPELGGLELAKLMRQRHPEVPLLLMTGFVEEPCSIPAEVPVLSKPFLPRELAHRLEQLLAGKRRARDAGGQGAAPGCR